MENHQADKKKFYRVLKAAIQGKQHLQKELKELIKEVAKTCRKEKKKIKGKYRLSPYEKIKLLT